MIAKGKSQSIMEYILTLTALVILIIAATVGFTGQGGLIQGGVENSLSTVQAQIQANLGLNYTGEIVNLTQDPAYANDPQLMNNLNYQDPEYNQYYFHEGPSTHINGIPIENIPQPGTIINPVNAGQGSSN